MTVHLHDLAEITAQVLADPEESVRTEPSVGADHPFFGVRQGNLSSEFCKGNLFLLQQIEQAGIIIMHKDVSFPTEKLKGKKLFLLDMDGTLYLDGQLFAGTMPFLRAVSDRGGRCLYLTNNSSKSVDAYVEKLAGMGISATARDFVTSVDATAAYIKEHYGEKTVFLLGTESFRRQMAAAGITGTTDRDDPDIAALVMGFDTELTFSKLLDASYLLTVRKDIGYVAANPDLVCPTSFGYVPDCGSVAVMLKNATGRMPVFIGKPEPEMVRMALKKTNTSPSDAVLIGDRVYTDIACGLNAGIDTVMVLSGEGTVKEAQERGITPTWIMRDIGEVADVIAPSENQ